MSVRRCGVAIALVAAVAGSVGCGDDGSGACTTSAMPGPFVTGAALFRVDLFAGVGCDALSGSGAPIASLSRTYAAGTPIVVDAPPGDYAVVVTSYRGANGSAPLGTACSAAHFAPGAKLCLSLALDAVDLATVTVTDPTDLGALDLAAVDLGYPSGAVLARDTFMRGDQKGWGIASDGQAWGGAGNSNTFGIVSGTGQVAAGGTATYPANLGPAVADAEVLATGAIMSSGGHWGGELRNGGSSTTYAAMLDGTTLTLNRIDNGTVTQLGQASATATIGLPFTLRFRAVGGTLSARVWALGSPEPTTWTVTATDPTPLGAGFGGLRFYVPASSYVLMSSFLLTAI